MGKLAWVILLIAVIIGVYYGFLTKTPEAPEIKDGWFGYGSKPKPDDTKIIKYKVAVPDNVLEDLKQRLDNTRLSEDLEESSFEYGMQVSIVVLTLRVTLICWLGRHSIGYTELKSVNLYLTL